MKILTRYVLREHAGPLTFAFTALTSLLLLNFISRQFGQLVGKGLPWSVIGQFFLLSIPFTVALTIPMSVLVAVLYAFSRLASENEITALKASGVSPWTLVSPALAGGVVMSLLLLAFNDQVLPRANHELKTLQDDIAQTKPTLLLKEQVINTVAEGRVYLRAGKIDQAGGRMREVVLYNLADPLRRRTIYADSGRIAFASNHVDLDFDLYHGQMQEVSTDKPGQLDRLFYNRDRIRVRNVGHEFKASRTDPASKGDREMSVCEMQRRLWVAETQLFQAQREYEDAVHPKRVPDDLPAFYRAREPHGIGWAYCTLLKVFTVKEAKASELQDTVAKPPVFVPTPAGVKPVAPAVPIVRAETTGGKTQQQIAAEAAAAIMGRVTKTGDPGFTPNASRASDAKLRLDMAKRARDRFDIEIHKKFSLAAACLIFCILAPPIALRFPRGGVGLVIGVSLMAFALYYVGLIGGEAAANHGLVPPFWAMWGTNVLMTVTGLVMLFRIGRDSGGARGGGLGEWLEERRLRREERRRGATGAAA